MDLKPQNILLTSANNPSLKLAGKTNLIFVGMLPIKSSAMVGNIYKYGYHMNHISVLRHHVKEYGELNDLFYFKDNFFQNLRFWICTIDERHQA